LLRIKPREPAAAESVEHQALALELQQAKQEWNLAEWRFHNALGDDHVDYAIYCLEAAEKKLDMLLRKAKWQWRHAISAEEGRGLG